jgi:hypothetical protein
VITTPTQLNAVAFQSGTYSSVTTAYLDVDAGLTPVLTLTAPVVPALRLRSDFGLVTGVGSPAPVTQWFDLSGSGTSATGTSGSQPTVHARSTGNPVVNFNGSSQFLSYSTLPVNFSQSYNGATLFVVTKPHALTANSRIFDFGQGASGNNILCQINSGPYGAYWTYSGTSGTSTTSSPTNLVQGQFQLLEATQNNTSPYAGTFFLNSIAGSSANMNAPTNVFRTSSYIGQSSTGGNYYSGDIAEILIFYGLGFVDAQLTDSQRRTIEVYFLQKYQMYSNVPETPLISVSTATLLQPTHVVLSGQPGALTFFTTDGTAPSATSQVYSGAPIPINYTQTLKAIAIKNGISSSVSSATYTLNANQFPAPSGSDIAAPTINLQLPTQSQ